MNRIIFIAKGWGRNAGGINVFNYSFCKSIGRLYGESIVCVVPGISSQECRHVKKKYKIHLVSMIPADFEDADAIIECLKNINVIEGGNQRIVWIGHDIFTGKISLECRNKVQGSKCGIIHHMAYHEYYSLLNDNSLVSLEKENAQRELLKEADFIFANGPKLKNSACHLVGDNGENKILEILPGMEESKDFINNANTFSVITFGRVEDENGSKKSNSIIKQTNLAVAAWASFIHDNENISSTNMDVIGYDKFCDIKKVNEEIKGFAEKYAKKILAIRAVPYMEEEKSLFRKISEMSLCMILSKEEGFGLACLEAISLGTPVIISESSGFFEALRERKLDNYVLSVAIEGKNEAPYFTENDLKQVKKKIHEFYYNRQQYEQNIRELREKLKNNGFSWEKSAYKMFQFMEIEIREDNQEQSVCETNIEKNKEIFGEQKWFHRRDLYNKIDNLYKGQKIIFVEGVNQSEKELSLIWWLKYKGINEKQFFCYQASEDRESDYFTTQIEEIMDSIMLDSKIYLLIFDFPVEYAKTYFRAVRLLLKKYSALNFIIFSDESFRDLCEIKPFYDYVRVSVEGLNKENVKDYFDMYGIDISEGEIEKLSPTEYLPGILKEYVRYILDEKVSITEAIQMVDIDIDPSEKVLNSLKKKETVLAGTLALFEAPFSIKMAKGLTRDMKYPKEYLKKLVHKGIILSNSEYSYKIPIFYRKFLRNNLSGEDQKRGYLKISKYYYYAYQYEWGSEMSIESLRRGMYACEFAIKAGNYEDAHRYLKKGKYAVYKVGLKMGMFRSLCVLMEELYDTFKTIDEWLYYNFVYCLILTGQIRKATVVLKRLGIISDRGCRTALLRLKGEIYYEYIEAQKVYEYILQNYEKPKGKEGVSDEQLRNYLLKLRMECGEYQDVINEIEENKKHNQTDYSNAVQSMYKLLCWQKCNKKHILENFDEVMKLFEKLNDERGILWVKREKGIFMLEKGILDDENYIVDVIKTSQRLGDCSKDYRLWLVKLCRMDVGKKISCLLEEERDRIKEVMHKKFIPKELYEYHTGVVNETLLL